MGTRVDSVLIRNIRDEEIHNQAAAADKAGNKDGVLQKSETSPQLFEKAVASSRNPGSSGWASGLTVCFADYLGAVAATASKFAKLGAMWGGIFEAISQGSRDINAVRRGEMSSGAAVLDTGAHAAVAMGSAAAGAAIGGALGSTLPVAGTIIGIIVGAGAGYLLQLAGNEAIDKAEGH